MANISTVQRKDGGLSYVVNYRREGKFHSRTYRDATVALAAKAAAEAGDDLPKLGGRPPETILMSEHLAVIGLTHERAFQKGWDACNRMRAKRSTEKVKRGQQRVQEAIARGEREVPAHLHGTHQGRYYYGCREECCSSRIVNGPRNAERRRKRQDSPVTPG